MTKKRIINYMASLVIILSLFASFISIGVLFAWLFNGEQIILRFVLIQPISIGVAFLIRDIWLRYNR